MTGLVPDLGAHASVLAGAAGALRTLHAELQGIEAGIVAQLAPLRDGDARAWQAMQGLDLLGQHLSGLADLLAVAGRAFGACSIACGTCDACRGLARAVADQPLASLRRHFGGTAGEPPDPSGSVTLF